MKKITLTFYQIKTYLISFVFTIAITTFLMSCETYKNISVTVVDSITLKPIDSVLVKINAGKNGDYNKNYSDGYTDISGKFQTDMMIGCSFGCYDIYMEYSKKGYENKTDLNVTKGTVLLNSK